jgi:hypothetical protein
MLHITKGVEAQVIFTGYELATLTDPNYLFIFTSATEEEIKFVPILFFIETNRYQKALILDTQFADAEAGTWRYRIREQVSSTNTDEALSGNIVEEGFMMLENNTTFEVVEYSNQDNQFITYDGE